MSSNWAEMHLGEFLELKRGYDLPKTDREEGDVPVVSSSGPTGTHSVSMAKAPGVVTGRYGTIGQVFYVEEDYWPLNTTLYVKDFKGNDPLFVYYLLKTINFLEYSDKAAVPGVNRNHLHKAIIRVPTDPAVQHDIAINLWNIDKKIQLNRQINQTLEHIAQTIFKSWFVDFDPVKAKIIAKQNGQDPERAAMRAISGKADEELDQLTPEQLQQLTATAALFPDELEDSELGEIPKGWGVGTLDDICRLNVDSWTTKNSPNEVWYVDLANAKNGIIEEVQHFTWANSPSRARRIVKSGDTIVGTVRPGNRSFALIGNSGKQLTASTGFAVLTPKKKDYLEYIYVAATSDSNIERLAHLADGAAYPAVRPEVVTQMEIVIPTEDVFKKFSEMTRPMFLCRENNFEQAVVLAGCRDLLLPKLLSGEITLSDALSPKPVSGEVGVVI